MPITDHDNYPVTREEIEDIVGDSISLDVFKYLMARYSIPMTPKLMAWMELANKVPAVKEYAASLLSSQQ